MEKKIAQHNFLGAYPLFRFINTYAKLLLQSYLPWLWNLGLPFWAKCSAESLGLRGSCSPDKEKPSRVINQRVNAKRYKFEEQNIIGKQRSTYATLFKRDTFPEMSILDSIA